MIAKSIPTLQGNIKINIPTSLAEITIGQMIAMESATGNEIPLIPQLTEDVVNNIINYADLIDIRDRVLSLAHQIKYAYNETQLPKTICFGAKQIPVIKNLSIEPAGAYLACRDIIADEINKHIAEFGEDGWKDNFTPSLNTCAMILAHYFYCPVTGELWNEQRAEAFKEEILKLSVSEGLPIARFFIRAYPNMLKQRIGLWQAFKRILKKKLALRRLKYSSGTTR